MYLISMHIISPFKKSFMLVLGPSIRCHHCPHKTLDESLSSLHCSLLLILMQGFLPKKKKKKYQPPPSILCLPVKIPAPPTLALTFSRQDFCPNLRSVSRESVSNNPIAIVMLITSLLVLAFLASTLLWDVFLYALICVAPIG